MQAPHVEKPMPVRLSFAGLAIVLTLLAPAADLRAQDATEKELEKYRQMLKDDPWSNPGLLDADRGEALWKETRGPKMASLEKCDLGKGPGKVEGAFAELPRYFKDADRVMDLESRIVWCMERLQGFKRDEILKRPYSKANQSGTELEALATYVAFKSRGLTFASRIEHAKEKEMLALGEALFFRRQGPMDFSCSTCHADAGKRIRLQGLPFLGKPEEARKVIGEWPAYRVSTTHVMTMQHRLYDCFWQMRMPELQLGSEASVALISFLTQQAAGGEIAAPGLKR
jgi:sulfur-oxidizing protein SoxA